MGPKVGTRGISGKGEGRGVLHDLTSLCPSGLLRGEATIKEGATRRQQAVKDRAPGKGRKGRKG